MCWQLAQTHGLAIATLMQTAQRDIVERERFSGRVDAGMAGARATAAMLAGLPAVGVGLGQLIGADPVSFLLSGGIGGWLLVVGVLLACGGLLWSDRITVGAAEMTVAAMLLAAAVLLGGDDVESPCRPAGADARAVAALSATPIHWPPRRRWTCSRRACDQEWRCRRPRRRRRCPRHRTWRGS